MSTCLPEYRFFRAVSSLHSAHFLDRHSHLTLRHHSYMIICVGISGLSATFA